MEYWNNLQKEDLEGEIWKNIENCDNYMISNLGRLKCLKWVKGSYYKEKDYPIIMKQSFNTKGYCCSGIKYNNGKNKAVRIHRLVGEHFIPNPNNLPQINHEDTIKIHNFEDNLTWTTNADNMQHAIDNGLRIDLAKGEKNGRALLKEDEVIYIYTNPDRLTSFEISKKFNVKMETLLGIYRGKNWKYLTENLEKVHINSNERFIKCIKDKDIYKVNKLDDAIKISGVSKYKIRISIKNNIPKDGWKFEYITYDQYIQPQNEEGEI